MKRASDLAWHLLLKTPLPWVLLGFCLYGWYAQFIVTVAWNAIELIIAQHLLEHGAYVTSIDYPSAITWRPVVPTLIVTFVRLFTDDPMVIYRLICASSVAVVTASLFYSAKRLWSLTAAHAAAVLTLTCPAVTVYLINHAHSYSHVGMMMVLGPAILAGLRLLRPVAKHHPAGPGAYALSGLLWGLAYLCRSELLLFAGLQLVALAVLHWKQKFPVRPLVAFCLPFAAILLAYNLHADRVAKKDDLVIRKAIYGMYASQGWVDPSPTAGPDIEGSGYVYALQLYGDPVKNDESLLKAIGNNPEAFTRRVRINLRNFYALYWRKDFVPPLYATLALIGAVWFILSVRKQPLIEQLPVWFLLSLFAASHFVLVFHVDPRYLTISVPTLVLLGAYAAHRLVHAPSRLVHLPAWAALVVVAYLAAKPQVDALRAHRPRNETSIPAMRTLGRHFTEITGNRPLRNREPHIGFSFPQGAPLYPEDEFLLGYFSRTSYVNYGAAGVFPRGKFYSYRDLPPDYLYLPAEKAADPAVTKGWQQISAVQVPGVGEYRLFKPEEL